MMEQLLRNFELVDDPNMPPWAKLLIEGTKLIISELQCVKDLAKRVDELESFKSVYETTTQNLLDENKLLRERLDKLEFKADDQEQRNRSFNLMVHGHEETDEEDTDNIIVNIVKNDLGIEKFSVSNIVRSHRTGPRQNARTRSQTRGKSRPIIFRLGDWRIRKQIFYSKKKLTGTGISITENLTKKRTDLLKLAQTKLGFGNVWTIEGRVTTKRNDKTVIINSEADLE